ncbi:MAG TPA: PAS domain-containing protein [Vicinamibacterales bacterium]
MLVELFERFPDGLLVIHGDRIVAANAAASQILTQPDLVDRSLAEQLSSTTRPAFARWLSQVQSGSAAPPCDVQFARRDGVIADAELTGARLGDGRIQIAIREVTARRRAEAELRVNEERLTLAFAGAQEGVWDWDLETGAVVYSSRWKQMLGYADEEVEPHVRAWERLLHADDLPRAQQVNETVMRGGGNYEMEVRLRHKAGHYVDVLSRGYPVRRTPDGPVVRIVGTHLDLTDRKRAEAALRESEERLTLAFAGAQEGVWDWNLETNAVVYSPRWTQMLGYGADEIEPHVSAWERLVHPEDRSKADQANERVARGEATYEAEFRLRHKDGHYVHVLSRGFPLRQEPGGPVVRIVGTHFDLTARKRAEAERTRTELLASLVFAQEDERRRIAREMHDQFGEQLTALTHRINALKTASAAHPDLHGHVEALAALAQRLDRDVDQLVWELRPTALDDLGLRAALANYVQDWSARVGIRAEFHTSGLLDDRLSPDVETSLYRIAQEALTNVARHSRATRAEVILERRPDHVVLIVEDDGIGFDANDSGDSDRAGTAGARAAVRARGGFGLRGMHERAALVDASLEIESAPGGGTTILVRMTVRDRMASDHG